MKLKSIYKYLIFQQGRGYLIYFGVMFVIIHLGLLLTLVLDTNGGIGGMEFGTIIFMTASGLVVYRESLSLSMQNGVSRKTFFTALILSFVTISVIAAAGDTILNIIGNAYEKHVEMSFDSLYEQTYFKQFGLVSGSIVPKISEYPAIFLMDFTLYIAVSALGTMIGAILYRLSKILKIIIPLSIWLIIQIGSFIILYIDFKFTDNKIMGAFLDFIKWIGESVYHLSALLPCAAVILSVIAFLFVRRVPLNDNKK